MRGVILAGGKGTRMRPATSVINKHLIPILNKPMILYPLETLKRLGITEIMIITGGEHIGSFAEFLGDGSEFGVDLTYRVQAEAGGIAQALELAHMYVASDERFCVILGDNIFDATVDQAVLQNKPSNIAQLFVKSVSDPERFGVLELDNTIVEKPTKPTSNKAITGLYIYPTDVFDFLPTLKPSDRGELEITDVNNWYLQKNRVSINDLGNSFWSDAGTPASLARVTNWVVESDPSINNTLI